MRSKDKLLLKIGIPVATALGLGSAVLANHDSAPKDHANAQTTQLNADLKPETAGELSDPVTTLPETTPVTKKIATATTAPPVTTEANTGPRTVPSGENELPQPTPEQIMTDLVNPQINKEYQNIMFGSFNIDKSVSIFGSPSAEAVRISENGEEGTITNAVLINEKFACFSMVSNDPENPGLYAACVDVEEAGIDVDTFQKGTMIVTQVLEDGRGVGTGLDGQNQTIAAFEPASASPIHDQQQ